MTSAAIAWPAPISAASKMTVRQSPIIAAPDSTCGAARSPASSSSKKSRGEKPNAPAIRLLGKDCTSTFRLRTAPL